MSETEKYVTPDQMREVVEKINALGLGVGGGGGASQSQVDALQAKVDAMPALVVVSDPAQAPAGSIAVVAIP